MKLLLLADKESRYLWDFYKPGCLREYDLMLSCGDLKAEYLTFLATLGRSPLLYVRGNHDDNYESRPPEGCECIEDKLGTVGGLRIVGLGGSPLYSGGRNQYTERQMEARIRKLGWKIRRAGGVDIVLTHAPARGFGDAEDFAHRGFEAFLPLLELLQVPEAVAASKTMIVGFTDMLTPSIIAAETITSAMTRFIVAVVSVTQLIYLSEVGGLILGSNLPVKLWELFVIFLERTIISLLIVCPLAHLIF